MALSTNRDAKLLEDVEAVTAAKAALDLADNGVKYYQRVLAAAEARAQEKRAEFLEALAIIKEATE